MSSDIKFDQIYTNVINRKCAKIIVIDVETDGKKCIVQIAYSICDRKLNIIKRESILINNGDSIVDFFHRFDYSTIKEKGVSPSDALAILQCDMNDCDYVIGHNVSWDIKMIHAFAKLNNYDFDIVGKVFNEMQIIDTMRVSKKLLDLKNKRGSIKNPKLSELYSFLIANERTKEFKIEDLDLDSVKQHTADYDVETTIKCVSLLLKMNVILKC